LRDLWIAVAPSFCKTGFSEAPSHVAGSTHRGTFDSLMLATDIYIDDRLE
jgi:hypothetical protein